MRTTEVETIETGNPPSGAFSKVLVFQNWVGPGCLSFQRGAGLEITFENCGSQHLPATCVSFQYRTVLPAATYATYESPFMTQQKSLCAC